MKQRLPIGLLLASLFASSVAHQRTLTEAESLARSFFQSRNAETAAQMDIRAVEQSQLKRLAASRTFQNDSDEAPFYIFNNHSDESFVMIAGSDLMRPVLGYSDHGTFPTDHTTLPENLRSWFEWLGEAATWLKQNPEAALTEQTASTVTPIAPLLGDINWDQSKPFNQACPASGGVNCLTGCMATAMAQVMYYHKYPSQGVGSHSYNWGGKTLSVNFAEETYNWDLMYDQYSTNCTEEQNAEVAKLNYHCGVSVNMSYGTDASGSVTEYYSRALVDMFGYNNLTTMQQRKVYGLDEWTSMLVEELQQKRPILFAGTSSSGGHAFILDGIDEQGYYHVNWGWEGAFNGYYDVCVLNPEGYGAGASFSEDGFSVDQAAIFQLSPQQNVGKYRTPIIGTKISTSTTQCALGGTATIRTGALYNHDARRATGNIGILITDDSGNELQRLELSDIAIPGISNYNIAGVAFSKSYTLPENLNDGNYRLYVYFNPTDTEYYDIIRCLYTEEQYLNMTVSNGTATFSKSKVDLNLSVSNWSHEKETYYAARNSVITVDVTNQSDESLAGNYFLKLTPPSGWSFYVQADKVTTIGAGETKTVSFSYKFSTYGSWKAELCVARQNITPQTKETIANTSTTIEVENDHTSGAIFTLTKKPWIESGTCELNSDITFGVIVQNAGEDYSGTFQIRIFKTKSTDETPLLAISAPAVIANGSKDTIYISGKLEGLEPQTSYYASAFYLRGADYELFDTSLSVSNSIRVNVSAPSTGIEHIEADQSDRTREVVIYNILGKIVGKTTYRTDANYGLPAGMYIIDGKKVLVR